MFKNENLLQAGASEVGSLLKAGAEEVGSLGKAAIDEIGELLGFSSSSKPEVPPKEEYDCICIKKQ